MNTILVTGGTGGLGRPTVSLLEAAGRDVRVLSRSGHTIGNLDTGIGLAKALDGVGTVLHLATTRWKDDTQTRNLLDAARDAGVAHLVYVSIVGVDRIPYAYYRSKLRCERMIEDSGIPFTILRATQFHDFVGAFLRLQSRWPVMLSLDVADQPIAVEEVAARLDELAASEPTGRVDDIGGPERLTVRELIDIWQAARGMHKRVWTVRLGGRMIAAFRAGHHMTRLPGFGKTTFAEYADAEATIGA